MDKANQPKELSKFLEIKFNEKAVLPVVMCSIHPQSPLLYVSPITCSLKCDKCLSEVSPMLKKPPLFAEVFENITETLKNFQKKLYDCFKELKYFQEGQITLFNNYKQKFIQIFDQYEKDSSQYFNKIKENLYLDIDFNTILASFSDLTSNKPLKSSDIQEKLSLIVDKTGLNLQKPLAFGLEDRITILLEQSRILNDELNIFLADSLETLKKSYNLFSSSSLEKIIKQTRYMKRNSFEEKPYFLLKDPQKTLEINGFTPFAKDIALIGEGKNGYLFSTCSNDEKIRIWKLKDLECENLLILSGHTDWINRMLFHEERSLLITSSRDHTVRIWDANDWKCIASLVGHNDSVYGLSCFNDSPILASGSYDKTVKLWDLESFSCKSSYNLENSVYEIRSYSIEEIGQSLVVGDSQGCLHFFLVIDGITLKKRQKVKGHEGCVLRLVYIHKDKLIASSANKDKIIKLWNSLTMTITHQLALHDERGVSGLFYDPISEILFTAGKDNSIKIIRIGDMEVVRDFKDSFIQFGGIAWINMKNVLLTCGGKKINQGVQMTINIRYF